MIKKAVDLVKAAGKLLGFGKKDDDKKDAKDAKHDLAMSAVMSVVNKAKSDKAKPEDLQNRLNPVKQEYGFKRLDVVKTEKDVEVKADLSPTETIIVSGKLILKLVYRGAWPLDEFMTKAKAIQKAATVGELMTLPEDPLTEKQMKTKGLRVGGQKEMRDNIHKFIIDVVPAGVRAKLLELLSKLQADHLVELQLAGAYVEAGASPDVAMNIAMVEGIFNRDMGWHELRPVLRPLEPGTVIDQVQIVVSKSERKAGRETGTATLLQSELLKYANPVQAAQIFQWFKLMEG